MPCTIWAMKTIPFTASAPILFVSIPKTRKIRPKNPWSTLFVVDGPVLMLVPTRTVSSIWFSCDAECGASSNDSNPSMLVWCRSEELRSCQLVCLPWLLLLLLLLWLLDGALLENARVTSSAMLEMVAIFAGESTPADLNNERHS